MTEKLPMADLADGTDRLMLADWLAERGRESEAELCRSDAQFLVRVNGRVQELKSLRVGGNRWFQRAYGNTYHRAYVYVNDELVYESEVTYGYGSQYEQTALEWLSKNGYLNGILQYGSGGYESLRAWCAMRGISYDSSVDDVSRKRDL